jgi:hypothetical protein
VTIASEKEYYIAVKKGKSMPHTLSQDEIDIEKAFKDVYNIQIVHTTFVPDKRELHLKDENERTCRFCKKSAGDVTFEKDAHRFPKFLGNQYLLWDEECDTCNALLGTYEEHLSLYLGLDRTLSDIRPGQKSFTFSSQKANLEVRRLGQMILFEQTQWGGIQGTFTAGQITLDVTPRPRIPAYIYCALLKTALSALPADEVPLYKFGFLYLLRPDLLNRLNGPRRMLVARSELPLAEPLVYLYKRKIADNRYPLHVMCLYVRNFMFQIVFPLSFQEVNHPPSEVTQLPAPYIDQRYTFEDPFPIDRYWEDLHDTALFTPPFRSLVLTPDPEALKNLATAQLPPDFLDRLKGKKK